MSRDSAKSTVWSFREEAPVLPLQVPLPASPARIALDHVAVGRTLKVLVVAGLRQIRTNRKMKVCNLVMLKSRTIKTL